METFHIIFLFTCDAVHVYTAATEESEHCHLVFRVLPMGRCACIFCSALLYDVPETRKCVEIVKTHFLSLILLLSFFSLTSWFFSSDRTERVQTGLTKRKWHR